MQVDNQLALEMLKAELLVRTLNRIRWDKELQVYLEETKLRPRPLVLEDLTTSKIKHHQGIYLELTQLEVDSE